MGNSILVRGEAEMTHLQPHLGDTRSQELSSSPFCPTPLFRPQLVKEGEDLFLKKAPLKTIGVLDPIKTDGPHKGSQTAPIPEQLAYHGPIPGGGTSEHSDRGRPDTVFRVDNQSREVRTRTHPIVFGLEIPPCKTHSREMAQTSGFDPMLKVKTCFDYKMFEVTNWVARSMEKMVPRDAFT